MKRIKFYYHLFIGEMHVICLLLILGISLTTCPRMCSNHGYCQPDFTCKCFPQWTGPDCAERSCPVGPDWNGNHENFIACSGRGVCNTVTGLCECDTGFSGKACQVSGCPAGTSTTSTCSQHGECITLSYLRQHYVTPTGDELEIYNGWDANRIYGCMCSDSYFGYDCSLQKCPVGSVKGKDKWDGISFFDVLHSGLSRKVEEDYFWTMTIINCRLPDDYNICEKRDIRVPVISTPEIVRSMIRGSGLVQDCVVRFLKSIDDSSDVLPMSTHLNDPNVVVIEINFVTDPKARILKITDKDSTKTIIDHQSTFPTKDTVKVPLSAVKMLENKKYQPNMKQCREFIQKDKENLPVTELINLCYILKHTEKVYKECTGNGECDRTIGELKTRDETTHYITDNYRFPNYIPTYLANCQITRAENSHIETCNGHGNLIDADLLRKSDDITIQKYCECLEGYSGPTCELHDCSDRKGIAWYSPALHFTSAVCSNMGHCNTKTGQCECFNGHYGNDCSQTSCPSVIAGVECSGHGICNSVHESMKIINPYDWNSLSLFECKCSAGFTGYNCNDRLCPTGPDPKEQYEGKPPHLTIQCDYNNTSTLIMKFNGNSINISPKDNLSKVKTSIMSLEGLKGSISFEDTTNRQAKRIKEENLSDRTLCDNSKYNIYFHYYCGNELSYTRAENFQNDNGIIIVDSNEKTISKVEDGTIKCYECSNHGYCDHHVGLCKCVSPYASSSNYNEDQVIKSGTRGDCSFFKNYEPYLNNN